MYYHKILLFYMSYNCTNCKKSLPGYYNLKDNTFIPNSYTTLWGGDLCSTGCSLNYMNRNQNATRIQAWIKKKLKNKHY